MRAALPVMAPGSAVVFTSSIAALRPTGRIVAYESSKAGLAALMRAVAFDGKDRAIRANIVMPGLIDTGIGRNATTRAWSGRPSRCPSAATAPRGRSRTRRCSSSRTSPRTSPGRRLAVDGGRTSL